MVPLTEWATVVLFDWRLMNPSCIISPSHIPFLMIALFLQTLHNGLLSRDAVRAELDFVHCGSYPLSEMEKISLLLGSQCSFAFLMLLTLRWPNLCETDGGLLSVLVPDSMLPSSGGKRGEQDNFSSIFNLHPFIKWYQSDGLNGVVCVCIAAGCLVEGYKRNFGFRNYT